MPEQRSPSVFVSYSHADKRVARRLARRMGAHGITVWLDERELRLGAALTSSLRSHIERADMVLVVASSASAESTWVELELACARDNGKTIVPFFVEPLSKHERFRDYKGVDATSPQEVGEGVHRLLRDLFASYDRELPPPDPAVLEASLRELAREEPDLGPLIHGCLDGKGLHQESMDTVFRSAFHPLDDALNALFDLRPGRLMAMHAAYGFCLAGAGARSLFSWIESTGDGGQELVTAMGRELAAPLLPTAIKLLGACDPPNNHALYMFIDRNAAQFDEGQRRDVLRLVTWPIREDTSRLADVLGWVAMKHFPDTIEVQQMWSRWIQKGVFDDKARDLARYFADAVHPAWESIHEELRRHVRAYLRSRDEKKVVIAIDHLRAAADAGAPVLSLLLREAEGVSGTAEWNDWRKRDPATAQRMQWHVFEFSKEAAGDRNWLRAAEGAKKMVEFEGRRQ